MIARRFCAAFGLLAAAALGLLPSACTPQAPNTPTPATPSAQGADLRVLVVDDPGIAKAIGELSGDWSARSGNKVFVSEIAAVNVAQSAAFKEPFDVIIYPSAMLGTLAERGQIGPLPEAYADNRELNWPDTFELQQVAETHWGPQVYAVPLGSPVFTCYVRSDLLEKTHRKPPRTWKEYQELAEFLAKRENLGDAAPPADASWYGTVEPLAKGWGGALLLARSAAYARHRDQYSTLFHIDTMKPLVAGPAFVRALDELVAAAKLGPPPEKLLDLDGARAEFLQGHAALAIAWPQHRNASQQPATPAPSFTFAELPGSAAVHNFAVNSWETRPADESPHVPLLSVSGRLGSVAAQTPAARESFALLAWLSGHDWGASQGSISAASTATTLYRKSQMRNAAPWVDRDTSPEAVRQYADSVRDALSRQAYLSVPRIPGYDRYLAALDSAVEAAVSGQSTSADALTKAAEAWSQITEELGLDAQRKAYRSSLGLEP